MLKSTWASKLAWRKLDLADIRAGPIHFHYKFKGEHVIIKFGVRPYTRKYAAVALRQVGKVEIENKVKGAFGESQADEL